MKIVVDTDAYSAFCRGDSAVIDILERADEIIVPVSVAGEIISVFLQGTRWEANWMDFQDFLTQPGISLQEPGLRGAEKYGLLVKTLKSAGTPIPTNDIWIAALALTLGADILTRDRHFQNVPGLLIRNF